MAGPRRLKRNIRCLNHVTRTQHWEIHLLARKWSKHLVTQPSPEFQLIWRINLTFPIFSYQTHPRQDTGRPLWGWSDYSGHRCQKRSAFFPHHQYTLRSPWVSSVHSKYNIAFLGLPDNLTSIWHLHIHSSNPKSTPNMHCYTIGRFDTISVGLTLAISKWPGV